MSVDIEAIRFSLRFRMFDNALMLCQEAFAQEKSANILYYYAKAYLESTSPMQAVMLCRQYISLVWQNPKLVMVYIQSLFESGNYSEAESIINQTPQKFPDLDSDTQSAISYYLGLIYSRTHRHENASSCFENIRKTKPSIVSVIPMITHEESSPKGKQEPVRHIIPPSQLRARKLLGSKQKGPITAQLFKSQQNIIHVMKNLSPDMQDSIIAQYLSALYYFKCSKYNEAAAIFTKMYEMHPHTIYGIDIYSTTLWQLKDEKRLSLLVQRAMQIAPGRCETWIASGNLLSLQHNTDAAVQMFQRAASIDKSCSYALALAGHELLLLESITEASKLFREAIDRNPLEWSAWYGLGSVHFKQDNFRAAQYYMKKALNLNPNSSVLHYVYAMVLVKCDAMEEAQAEFDAAIELDPSNLIPVYQKGLLLANSDPIEALQYLDKAEALAPHEPGIAYQKGQICYMIGDTKGATEMYTNALIYGHPDKKEIHSSIENMMEKVINEFLQD